MTLMLFASLNVLLLGERERERGRALFLAIFWINLEGKPSKFGVNTVEPDVNRVSLGSDLN